MDTNRPSKDEYFFRIAEDVASRSTCQKRHVGAVIVKDDHIISTGYNGPSRGISPCNVCVRKYIPSATNVTNVECKGCHAEINSILFAAMYGNSIEGSTLYITTAPCFDCSKYIINSGIKKVIIPTLCIREPVKMLLHEAGIELCILPKVDNISYIDLTKGKTTKIDSDLYPMLSAMKWCSSRNGDRWYATRRDPITKNTNTLHRYIADYLGWNHIGMDIDHINHDGLDNRICNLRVCPRSINNSNRKDVPKHNTSGYIGVGWHKQRCKWRAQIQVNGKQKFLGLFDDPIEAALVYNKAAIAYFGEHALLNDVEIHEV